MKKLVKWTIQIGVTLVLGLAGALAIFVVGAVGYQEVSRIGVGVFLRDVAVFLGLCVAVLFVLGAIIGAWVWAVDGEE